MKLSEAIRLGAMSHPQVQSHPFIWDAKGNIIGTCALGSALFAIGRTVQPTPAQLSPSFAQEEGESVHDVMYLFPDEWGVNKVASCPQCKGNWPWALAVAIAHMNDVHRWTREQIADWVAEALEAKPVPVVCEPEPICA